MSDVPVQLVVAAFQDEDTAKNALNTLKDAQREKLIKIDNAAVLRKDEKGKLHITETQDMGGGKGAVIGGVIGGAIGILAGPLLFVPAAVGALVGGLYAKFRDSGFENDRLEAFGEGLKPGTSAIVAVVEHRWVQTVQDALAETAMDTMTAEISADIAAQLEQGHEVAYSALATEESFSVERLAGGEDQVEASRMVVDETGMFGGRYVATKDGFVVEGLAAGDEGVAYFEAEGVADEEESNGETSDEAPEEPDLT